MILGAADGVVIVLGLLLSLAIHQPGAIWHAAVGAGLAELVGMTSGMWLSDGRSGFVPALVCGAAAGSACVAPAVPYLVATGGLALAASLALIAATAAVISWLRPERGVLAVVQTYGVLITAAGLCTAAAAI